MKFPRTPGNNVWILAASLLVCLGTWRWAQHVLIPANTTTAQKSGVPIGNNSDLYPRWLGARELLVYRRDPYSVEVTRSIQAGFYGRPLDPSRPADPTDQAAFAYPVYVVFLLAPAVALPFGAVSTLCRWLFLSGIAISILLWMRAIEFRAKPAVVLSLILLSIGTYPSVLEFYMQNLTAVVAVLLALASTALVYDWLVLSGFLLALSTIKPQLAAFFVIWFLLWAFGDWKKRRKLLLSFVLSMLVLVLAGEVLLPGWIAKFLAAVRSYSQYSRDLSGLRMFFPSSIAWALAVVLVGAIFVLGWQSKRSPTASEQFAWMLALVAAVTVVIAPIALYNQVALVPALLVLLHRREAVRRTGLIPRALLKAVGACLAWQWISAAILGLVSLFVSGERLHGFAYVPVYTSLALPPITLLAIAAVTITLRRQHASGTASGTLYSS